MASVRRVVTEASPRCWMSRGFARMARSYRLNILLFQRLGETRKRLPIAASAHWQTRIPIHFSPQPRRHAPVPGPLADPDGEE
ncbi:hypothetical protein ACW7G2_06390 [Luteimonas sp. A277]